MAMYIYMNACGPLSSLKKREIQHFYNYQVLKHLKRSYLIIKHLISLIQNLFHVLVPLTVNARYTLVLMATQEI